MLRNYLKIAFRNLWKNRLFTAINVLGMSVGMACVVVLVLFAQKLLTWDDFHQKGDRIYYVQSEMNGERNNQTVYPILDQLLKDYPEIETGTHIQAWYTPWIHYGSKDLQERTVFVDSTFFQIFSYPFKFGNAQTALQDKYSVVLSEKVAKNLFGDADPTGKIVTLDDTLPFKITGVFAEIPSNSSQQFEVVLPTSLLKSLPGFQQNADWYNTFAAVFLLLKEDTDKAALEAKLPKLVKTHFAADAQKQKLHLNLYKNYVYDDTPIFASFIYGAITVAAFLLLIISINLVNLNVASALPRVKEVAMRRVLGATKKLVLNQFWIESGLVILVSLGLSVLFAVYYLIPGFNTLRDGTVQLSINFINDYPTILTVLGISLLVAVVAGTYPALYLMRLKTTEAVKGKLSVDPRRGRTRQNSLIVLQFALAIILIVGTIGMKSQIEFMKNADVGYDKNNVLVFRTGLAYKNENTALSEGRVILDELRRNANVESFCASDLTLVQYWQNFNNYYPDGNQAKVVKLRHVSGAVNYFETYKIPFIEGRGFSDASSADSANNAVVLNEAALKAFGWQTAVGKKLRQLNDNRVYTVIGVTKDFHYQSLKDHVEPLLHWYGGRQQLSNFLTVRLTDETKGAALTKELEARFKKIPARRALSYFYLTDEIAKVYQSLDNIWRIIVFVTMIAILTACAGIFGLISLVAKQRTKEIGVRKVLGASVLSITALLSKDFLKLVGIALVVAIPISYWLGEKLLDYFAYRVATEWWHFGLAAALAVGIALVSVVFQAIKAALMNPVKSLKTE
ncbi:MAG: FtsX-like permease family protein [Cytophagales bacterium]|nr:MAG: FtsX-like permease family protein [Cytophagales bacterium]